MPAPRFRVVEMWLIVSLIAALAASAAYLKLPSQRKQYKLGFLALMLWGTTIMVAVDHAMAFLSGEPFIEFTTDGIISSSILLGIAMLVPIFLIWTIAVYTPLGKRITA